MENKLAWPVRGSHLAVKEKSKRSGRSYPVAYGGTSLSFSGGQLSRRPKWAIVGQEGGSIQRSQVTRLLSGTGLAADDLKKDGALAAFRQKEDEYFQYAAHIGAVRSVDFSPFNRNLFLSAGEDGSVKLFHAFNSQPLLLWEPTFQIAMREETATGLCAAKFSPLRPTVFATGALNGGVYIYDLAQSLTSPVVTLDPPEDANANKSKTSTRKVALTDLAFNGQQRNLLAACDASGRVHIWKLGIT